MDKSTRSATDAVTINVPAVTVLLTLTRLAPAASVPVAPPVPENVAVPVPAPMEKCSVAAAVNVTVFVPATAKIVDGVGHRFVTNRAPPNSAQPLGI